MAAQERRLRDDPPAATVLPQQADVLRPLGLPPLDGIIAANLLHFVRDQAGLRGRLRAALRPDGRLLVVEYEQTLPIPWVPYPLPFPRDDEGTRLDRLAVLTSGASDGVRRL